MKESQKINVIFIIKCVERKKRSHIHTHTHSHVHLHIHIHQKT